MSENPTPADASSDEPRPADAVAAGPAPGPEAVPAPENPPAPEGLPEPDAAPGPAAEPVPTKKRLRRGRIAVVAGSVLLAAAVLGGAGYTVVTVENADRDPGAPTWDIDEAEAADEKEAAPTGLAAVLVPYGSKGYERGPDLGTFGAEAVLSGEQATALRKERLQGMPRTQRKQLEKAIDRQRISGLAMRSYVTGDVVRWGSAEDVFTMSIELAQMENRSAVRDTARFQSEFLDAMDVFRDGPKIKGHKNAHCFLPPKDDEEELDTMYCVGHVGNVLVTAITDGAAPLRTKEAAMLLREQLDRITEPGESV